VPARSDIIHPVPDDRRDAGIRCQLQWICKIRAIKRIKSNHNKRFISRRRAFRVIATPLLRFFRLLILLVTLGACFGRLGPDVLENVVPAGDVSKTVTV